MELGEPDASGRRSPVAIPGATETIDIDLAIVSVRGFSQPDCAFFYSGTGNGTQRYDCRKREHAVIYSYHLCPEVILFVVVLPLFLLWAMDARLLPQCTSSWANKQKRHYLSRASLHNINKAERFRSFRFSFSGTDDLFTSITSFIRSKQMVCFERLHSMFYPITWYIMNQNIVSSEKSYIQTQKKEEQLASLLLLSSFPKLNQDYMGKDTESNN